MACSISSDSIILLNTRPWYNKLTETLSKNFSVKIIHIKSNRELENINLEELKPRFIFVVHWNHKIPKKVWSSFKTIVFHMTDLPYGRGGSPLQNLIKKGHDETVISAIECIEQMDAGKIFMKKNLSLHGSAEEIFLRANDIVCSMICDLIEDCPQAYPQKGDIVNFTRRVPSQSNLEECEGANLDAFFDQIRMLDADGYPHAYLDINGLRIEFRRVSKRSDGLVADAYFKLIDK